MVVVEQSRDTDRLSLRRNTTVIVNINLENDTTRVMYVHGKPNSATQYCTSIVPAPHKVLRYYSYASVSYSSYGRHSDKSVRPAKLNSRDEWHSIIVTRAVNSRTVRRSNNYFKVRSPVIKFPCFLLGSSKKLIKRNTGCEENNF